MINILLIIIAIFFISLLALGIAIKTRLDLWDILEECGLVKSKEEIKADAVKKMLNHNKKKAL